MKIVKQKISLSMRNVDDVVGEGQQTTTATTSAKSFRKHSVLLPNNVRCIICGPSGVGKTNIIINLLEDANGLRFENVYIYSKSLFQPKYKYLGKLLSSIDGVDCYMYSSNDEVIPIDEVKPNSVFIFDDVVTSKQKNIQIYFCMGRHKGIDLFYLTQSFAHIPKHLIRENANLIVLFQQDDMNLRHVYNNYGIASDMTFDKFKEICTNCWQTEKHGFLVICTENPIDQGKYRMQFDRFIVL